MVKHGKVKEVHGPVHPLRFSIFLTLSFFSFLPPSHAGTLSAPAFFLLQNNLRGSKLISNEVATTSS